MSKREYQVVVAGGHYALYAGRTLRDLAEIIDALRCSIECVRHGAYVQSREVAEELGTPWQTCQEDLLLWTRPDYEGRQGRIYICGNGKVCFGRKAAVQEVFEAGIFSKEEAEEYVDAIR